MSKQINLNKEVDKILSVCRMANTVGIDSVIIDKIGIRGVDQNKTTLIFNPVESTMPAIAINRVQQLISQIELFDLKKATVIGITDQTGNCLQMIQITQGRKKIDHRLGNPNIIKAPKQINDVFDTTITFNDDDVDTLIKSKRTISGEHVELSFDGTSFEIVIDDQINGDKFVHQLEDDQINGNTSFSYKYLIDSIIVSMKNNSTKTIHIGQKGMLKFDTSVAGIFFVPRII
jgi:hypothetical protein